MTLVILAFSQKGKHKSRLIHDNVEVTTTIIPYQRSDRTLGFDCTQVQMKIILPPFLPTHPPNHETDVSTKASSLHTPSDIGSRGQQSTGTSLLCGVAPVFSFCGISRAGIGWWRHGCLGSRLPGMVAYLAFFKSVFFSADRAISSNFGYVLPYLS